MEGVKLKLKESLLKGKRGDNEDEGNNNSNLWSEIGKIWRVAGPAIFTRFSMFGINLITQAFIGHIGSIELAAFSLVSTVLSRFTVGIQLGMASALQTLCGQSFGAKQYHMLGIHLQRSWIVMLTATLLLLPIFIFTTPLLKSLGQESHIARVAGLMSYWQIPVMFSNIVAYTSQMFLQAQSKNNIISYLAALSITVHVVLSWVFTVKYSFGVVGAMVASCFTFWLPNIGQLMFIMCGGCRDTWNGFSVYAFSDLWPVVKLSVSSGLMLCLELWYTTILVLLTGNMKNSEVAIDALSICLNVNGLEMMISLGFAAAASVRVSNELGRGSSKAAKYSIVVTNLVSLGIGFILFTIFLFLRGHLAYVFTNNPMVAKEVANLSPLLAFSILLNSIQPVLSGVAIGAGWQSVVAYVNVASYYMIGIPVGILLGYVMNLGVQGVWIGMLFGTLLQSILLLIITWKTDWDNQVILAQKRVSAWVIDESKESTFLS